MLGVLGGRGPWKIGANECHKVTLRNRRQGRDLLGEGGYTKLSSEQGWRRKRASCEGTGFIKGHSTRAKGEYATRGDSGNVSHLAAGAELLKVAFEAEHLVLECDLFSIFQHQCQD